MSNDATLHIAELAKASIQHIDIDAGYLIKEIQQDYAKAMCEIVYDHAMNNNDMESVLCMPQQPNKVQKAKNVPNTEKSTGYADQFIGFSFQTYLTCSEVSMQIAYNTFYTACRQLRCSSMLMKNAFGYPMLYCFLPNIVEV